MILFRPVGLRELELVFRSGMREFPPRLPEQPIFYPILNEAYAVQIARDWNTKDEHSDHAGFVLRFEVDDRFLEHFPRKCVGGQEHEEFWIPADRLKEFNAHIRGIIEVVGAFVGEQAEIELEPGRHIPLGWESGESVAGGRFLDLRRVAGWEYVHRKNISGIVGIVAVTDDDRVVLVEQFRPALQRRVVEIPAGLAGDIPGSEKEAMAEAARRELLEETGYRAARMTLLLETPTSAGLTDETVNLFLAEGLVKVGDGGGDEQESIQVHEVPLKDLLGWLEKKQSEGCMIDSKIFAGLYLR